jgi:flavin reductase (DIM6/NTAB) family NADH-FMN oxidoreductase RutF
MEGFETYRNSPSLFPSPVAVVGAYKDDGQANFSVSAWAGTVCSNPPMLSVTFGEATLTHSLLEKRREFTVSITGSSQIPQVDYVGSKTGRTEDKAASVHWDTAKASKVNAPYSPSFGLVYQCRLVESKKLGLHTIYFGEIVEIDVRTDCVGETGGPSIAKLDPLLFTSCDRGYYKIVPESSGIIHEICQSLVP